MTAISRRLLPDTAAIGHDGMLEIGGCSVEELVEEFGTPLFVYDEAHLRARCREAVAAFGRDRVDLRDQGLPVSGNGAARVRRRAAARRRHRRRTARRARRRRPGRAPAHCTATTSPVPNSARRSRPRFATSSSIRSTNSIASTSSLPPASARPHASCCGSRPACTPTPTSSSPPARTIRSSASTLPTATRCRRSTVRVGPTRSISSECTATSAPTCSRRRRSPRPPR